MRASSPPLLQLASPGVAAEPPPESRPGHTSQRSSTLGDGRRDRTTPGKGAAPPAHSQPASRPAVPPAPASGPGSSYARDEVFHSKDSTAEVYERVAAPIISSAIQEYNGSALALLRDVQHQVGLGRQEAAGQHAGMRQRLRNIERSVWALHHQLQEAQHNMRALSQQPFTSRVGRIVDNILAGVTALLAHLGIEPIRPPN